MPGTEPAPIAIPLPDGDELWNAARVGEFLGVGAATVWGYASKGLPKNNPFPDHEPDPVGLIVTEPALADPVRLLMAVDARVPRGQAAPQPPRVWRASKIRAWETGRTGRGNWHA